jgi:hypothetical protein
VPGRRRVHQAGWLAGLPLLELTPHHFDRQSGQVLARDLGHLGAELDAGDPEPAPGQRPRGLARSAAHLEQGIARLQAGQRDEIIEQGVRILRTDPIVALGGLVKRLPQPLALLVGMHRASIAPMILRPGCVLT